MPREKELFRINLERLDRMFPDKELLTCADVCKYTGLERHTARRKFKFDGHYIAKSTLANQIS